jgi:hypothetical protein
MDLARNDEERAFVERLYDEAMAGGARLHQLRKGERFVRGVEILAIMLAITSPDPGD